jgi:anaerobic ribonucleoside-triphosphate reductase activating protein
MPLRINKIHWPVTVLGYGRRVGIWTQGCTIHCKDCCSTDTWDPTAGALVSSDELLATLQRLPGDTPLDGITLTGGEPFDQAEGLAEFLRAVADWRASRTDGGRIDVLCYSGYPLERLQKKHPDILALLDAVIADPFVASRPVATWRGSDNQRLVPLTPLGEERGQTAADAAVKRLQYHVEHGRVWFVGIPARGDLARLETDCASRGLALRDVSWRS